jgi:hypothetical protein
MSQLNYCPCFCSNFLCPLVHCEQAPGSSCCPNSPHSPRNPLSPADCDSLIEKGLGRRSKACKTDSLRSGLKASPLFNYPGPWRRRAGSVSTSISTIFPRVTVKPMTENGRPPGSHETIPAAPFTSTGRANSTSREKVSACSATARAPRASLDAPGNTAPPSARTTTPGSSTARSASKSPPRANEIGHLAERVGAEGAVYSVFSEAPETARRSTATA